MYTNVIILGADEELGLEPNASAPLAFDFDADATVERLVARAGEGARGAIELSVRAAVQASDARAAWQSSALRASTLSAMEELGRIRARASATTDECIPDGALGDAAGAARPSLLPRERLIAYAATRYIPGLRQQIDQTRFLALDTLFTYTRQFRYTFLRASGVESTLSLELDSAALQSILNDMQAEALDDLAESGRPPQRTTVSFSVSASDIAASAEGLEVYLSLIHI